MLQECVNKNNLRRTGENKKNHINIQKDNITTLDNQRHPQTYPSPLLYSISLSSFLPLCLDPEEILQQSLPQMDL